ncbi:squalene/phytoene synthase family protein [uncultured Sphingomonas sp.]|uniref:squalene/phytoene synthase family protein n=1 Tax=uncultured Sphingomonas sp. TaxID=158754 RepID=UPI0037478E7B
MVNSPVTIDGEKPEQAIAVAYAGPALRAGLRALLTLDQRLGAIVRATREPIVGQMRLTWWHEALSALDHAAPPAEPILQALAGAVIGPVRGAALACMIEGWEVLLDPALDADALQTHATKRGGTLFAAMARIAGADNPAVERAGEGWALTDLTGKWTDETAVRAARDMARDRLDQAAAYRWPVALRAVGALALSARMDLAPHARPHGHPARVARLLWLRMSGR